ncbi:hypothetical protein HanRHA438_Chr04g0180131 [Helianthus annuus]|nr:hypothetical protein HanRHA438_Chr04g0180131 [Helianthus annuus]
MDDKTIEKCIIFTPFLTINRRQYSDFLSHLSFLYLSLDIAYSLSQYLIYFLISTNNNNKALPRFKYCNSRSPLPFPIDLEPITHVRALPD